MHSRQIAKLALWALLLAQLGALPLPQWLGLGVCTMGCASEGWECCCERPAVAPAHDDHASHGHHAASEDLQRFSRPAAPCAPECSGVLEGPRQTLRISLDVIAGDPHPPAEGRELLSRESNPARGGRYNPAIGPRAPPFLFPPRV